MATSRAVLAGFLLLLCFVETCYGTGVLLSTLPRTLLVTASPKQADVLKGGESKMTVTWQLNQTAGADTSSYKTITLKLCYAPISQEDRGWRKTVNDLSKDKTCQFKIVSRPYNPANNTVQSYQYTVAKNVPTATYFVRAYALDTDDKQVAYGQTTDKNKTTNLFQIEAISGRHVSLDIASICFSAFSVVSLMGFFFVEKRKAKIAQRK